MGLQAEREVHQQWHNSATVLIVSDFQEAASA
jgi:hypothetical protein